MGLNVNRPHRLHRPRNDPPSRVQKSEGGSGLAGIGEPIGPLESSSSSFLPPSPPLPSGGPPSRSWVGGGNLLQERPLARFRLAGTREVGGSIGGTQLAQSSSEASAFDTHPIERRHQAQV